MASSTVRPASGTLGILTPGLGAVATTFMAGVESIRRGHTKPIGSLTQMATIRLGKRTDNRSPLIKDFVPLTGLDDIVFGAWDPSLALVMGSALGISALAFRWSRGRSAPLSAQAFTIPAKAPLDRPLVVGAALFGVGWGLSGFCPGPSIVALAGAGSGTIVFVLATLFGILLATRLERTDHRRSSDPGELGKPVTP